MKNKRKKISLLLAAVLVINLIRTTQRNMSIIFLLSLNLMPETA